MSYINSILQVSPSTIQPSLNINDECTKKTTNISKDKIAFDFYRDELFRIIKQRYEDIPSISFINNKLEDNWFRLSLDQRLLYYQLAQERRYNIYEAPFQLEHTTQSVPLSIITNDTNSTNYENFTDYSNMNNTNTSSDNSTDSHHNLKISAEIINYKMTILPHDFKFPTKMSCEQLIQYWLIGIPQKKIVPFSIIKAHMIPNYKNAGDFISKMKNFMKYIKHYGKIENKWMDNQIDWTNDKVIDLWNAVKYKHIYTKLFNVREGDEYKELTWMTILKKLKLLDAFNTNLYK